MCVRRDQDADEDGDVVEEAIRVVLVAVTPLERAFVVVVAVVVAAEKRVI